MFVSFKKIPFVIGITFGVIAASAAIAWCDTDKEAMEKYYRSLPILERLLVIGEDMVKEKLGMTPSYERDGAADSPASEPPAQRPRRPPVQPHDPSAQTPHRPPEPPRHPPRPQPPKPPRREHNDRCGTGAEGFGLAALSAAAILRRVRKRGKTKGVKN